MSPGQIEWPDMICFLTLGLNTVFVEIINDLGLYATAVWVLILSWLGPSYAPGGGGWDCRGQASQAMAFLGSFLWIKYLSSELSLLSSVHWVSYCKTKNEFLFLVCSWWTSLVLFFSLLSFSPLLMGIKFGICLPIFTYIISDDDDLRLQCSKTSNMPKN